MWAPLPEPPVAFVQLQTYLVKLAFTSATSSVPLLLASNPTSTLVPPLAQFAPAGSVVVFTKVFLPSNPLVPVAPVKPLMPCAPVAPVVPVNP